MWVLPSRGRPHNVARFIDAYRRTGATTPVWLRFDHDDPQQEYDVPDNWIIEVGPRGPLSSIYNEFFAEYPNLDWYGFIADDVVPETFQWDKTLIEAAGKDRMAVPVGGKTTGGTPHFVLGGDLVRSVGWLALPGLERLYIDTVWGDIARKRDVLEFLLDVTLEHHHFSNNKALFDATYRKPSRERDKILYQTWKGEDHGSNSP